MHLKTIQLRQWSCHDDLLVRMDKGLNVCVGPNGAGKTTLYQAIVTALTTSHTTLAREMRGLRPWGTGGSGPTAILEIVRGAEVWRLTKTYLDEPACLLESQRDGSWQKDKHGRQAESQLDAWLEGDGAAGRLILALWSRQDDPIRIFADLGAASSQHVPATLLEQFAAGHASIDANGPFGHVKQSIKAEYDKHFTTERRDLKKGSPLDLARKAFTQADAHREGLQLRRSELTAKIAAYESRRSRHEADCLSRAEALARKCQRDQARSRYSEAAEALRQAEAIAAALHAEFEARKEADRRLLKARDAFVAAEATAHEREARRHVVVGMAEAKKKSLVLAETRQREADGPLDELASLYDAQKRLEEARQALETRTREVSRLRAARDRTAEVFASARLALATARADLDRAERVASAALRASRHEARITAEADHRRAESAFQSAEAAGLARERGRLGESLELLRGWQDALAALEPSVDGGPVPTDADLIAIRQLDRVLDRLGGELAGDALTLRFLASGPVSARVSSDGRPESVVSLQPGELFEGEGVAALWIAIEGVGRIEVGRTSADLAGRIEERERARADLAARLLILGAADLESLEERRRRKDDRRRLREQIEGRLSGLSMGALEDRAAEIDRLLAGRELDSVAGADLSALKARRDATALALASAQARCDGDSEYPPGEDGPSWEEATPLLEAARRKLDLAVKAERAAETAFVRAGESLNAAEAGEREARSQHDSESGGLGSEEARADLRRRIEAAHQPLAMLDFGLQFQSRDAVQMKRNEIKNLVDAARKAFDGAEPAAREAERQAITALADRGAKRARLEEVRAEVGPPEEPAARAAELKQREHVWLKATVEVKLLQERLPADPDADLAEFLARYEAIHRACDEGKVELDGLRAVLDVEGAQGLDTQLARAAEECERRGEEARRLEKDTSAWALLHHLLAEVEERQAKGIAAKVEELATGLVARLTGGNVRGVTLDSKTLAPAWATANRDAASSDIKAFSRGTREQVALTCRLQIGRLLGREARHMLLLDDPLAHTDPARHREALAELIDLSRSLQVIVFTCHLDRYGPLLESEGANRIDIPGRR